MNKAIFFTGLGIILLELIAVGVYFLGQQNYEFIRTVTIIITVGGLNLAAIIMMFAGLFEKDKNEK